MLTTPSYAFDILLLHSFDRINDPTILINQFIPLIAILNHDLYTIKNQEFINKFRLDETNQSVRNYFKIKFVLKILAKLFQSLPNKSNLLW